MSKRTIGIHVPAVGIFFASAKRRQGKQRRDPRRVVKNQATMDRFKRSRGESTAREASLPNNYRPPIKIISLVRRREFSPPVERRKEQQLRSLVFLFPSVRHLFVSSLLFEKSAIFRAYTVYSIFFATPSAARLSLQEPPDEAHPLASPVRQCQSS